MTGRTLTFSPAARLGRGIDYNHGTGHGVGYLLSVHEGPQRIHWSIASNARHTALEPGMIFSDEPGLYLCGKIRRAAGKTFCSCARREPTPTDAFFRSSR